MWQLSFLLMLIPELSSDFARINIEQNKAYKIC